MTTSGKARSLVLRWLPNSRWALVLCGMLVVLPTIFAGLFMDDALARVKLLGLDTPWSPAAWWDLYTFARPDINAKLLAAGHHPWWADPAVKMTFFRPLSAATHILDYALWPHSPMLQHLHSIAWYGLAVGMAVSVFQAIHKNSRQTVLLAGFVFAVAPPHALAVGWLASRNTIIAFVVACLLFLTHLRWRKGGGWPWLLASLGLLIVGFFTSEAILAGLAYIAAWELCLNTGSWKNRIASLIPYGIFVVLWRLWYVAAGFGAAGTSIYRDPSTDFLGFVQVLLTNFPILIFGRWVPIPLDFWAILPTSGRIVVLLCTGLFFAALVALLWPMLRDNKKSQFWTLGMLLSVVPFTLTVPMDRLTLFAGLGLGGLIGLFASTPLQSTFRSKVRTGLLWFYVPTAAILCLVRAGTLGTLIAINTVGYHQAPQDKAVPSQTFVYVQSTFHRVHYTTLMRKAAGHSAVPKRSVVLSSMLIASTLTRTDAHTLEVRPKGGFMLLELDRIHRRVTKPFSQGDVVRLPDVTITVTKVTSDGRPAIASFRFHVPLEHKSLRWLIVKKDKNSNLPFPTQTVAFPLPKIGQTVQIEPVL